MVALALPLALMTAVAPAAAQNDDDETRAEDRPEWLEPWEVVPTTAFAEVDVDATADDRRDRWAIEDIERQWRDAARFEDPLAERTAHERLMRWIENELAEDQFEVDAERRELAEAQQRGDEQRVTVERMELMRARADLAETERAYKHLQGLQLAFDEGRATDAHRQAQAAVIAELVRLAEDEVRVSGEEEREDREAYLDSLRVAPSDQPA